MGYQVTGIGEKGCVGRRIIALAGKERRETKSSQMQSFQPLLTKSTDNAFTGESPHNQLMNLSEQNIRFRQFFARGVLFFVI